MSDLKPCPFCGAQPNVFPANPKSEGDAWTSIECANCVTSPPATQSMARVTHYAESGHFEQAVAAWNTRTPDPRITQLEAEKAEAVARGRDMLAAFAEGVVWNDEQRAAYEAMHATLSRITGEVM